jgi:hypothetical protein
MADDPSSKDRAGRAKESTKRSDDKKKRLQQELVGMLPDDIQRKSGLANQLKQTIQYFQ